MAAAAVPAAPAAGRTASAAGQVLAGLVGLACAAVAAWLAWHHPLSPMLALAGVALLAAAQAAWPPLWLVALPALLPWLGLGAWSGWLLADEMDLAILAVAAGAYLRWAVRPGPRLRAGSSSRRVRAWGSLLLLLWAASVLVALQRGALDAGGWSFGWWQGYREPLNALRLAKPTLATLLLLPLWWRLQQRPGQRCAGQLSLGLALGLAGTTLWCLWERLVYTGLLNMSTDYRTTGPFWETNFGGAALDVFLALSLPFALRLALSVRAPVAAAAAWLLLLGGIYASLTTFSRIVYLALPLGAALQWWLQHRQDRASAQPAAPAQAALPALLLCVAVAGMGAWMFPSAGYRGLLALLGNAVLLLLLVPRSVQQPLRFWAGAWLLGLVLGSLMLLPALLMDKGAYLAYGALTLLSGALLLLPAANPALAMFGGAGFVAQLGCTVLVALHWGGVAAWPAAAAAAAGLAMAWLLLGRRAHAPWPVNVRWLGGTSVGMVLVLAAVAVFSAGDFMASRLGQAESDRGGRWDHWRDSLALTSGGTALWLGQGLGRYADLYALNGRPDTRPGDIRFMATEGGTTVRMVAGNHMLGHGELLRLSQRITRPPDTGLSVQLEVRAAAPVSIQAEVCFKHLLYDGACRVSLAKTQPGRDGWQTLQVRLPDALGLAAPGFPAPTTVFSLASETPRQPLDLRAVVLTDASGRSLLANGRFAEGGAHWFSTSDRNHLPWHAKNLAVHLLVEQGLLGLLAMVALTLAALVSLLGPLRRHPLAPALAAALLGCWVVGSVDSVLDMPRVATWLLLLTGMALRLHVPSRAQAAAP